MDTFYRDAACSVLTSALNELSVLSQGRNFRANREMVKEKGKKNKSEKKYEVDTGKLKLPIAKLNEIKLNNDLMRVVDIFTTTIDELHSSGTIQKLLATINQQIKQKSDEERVIQEHFSNRHLIKNLKLRLTEYRAEGEEKLSRESKTLNSLKADWRIVSKINDLEYELVKKWEDAKFDQAVIFGEKKEKNLQRTLEICDRKIKTEQRVIFDYEVYFKKELDSYRGMVEMWKNKYDKEMSELLSDITEIKNKIKEVNKAYEKHFEIFCKRQIFIQEYKEQEAEKVRLYNLEIQRIDSAVKIQAWWRGVMVRRCLGPFKKKVKKGKKVKKTK